ncbi:hypothetical protein [Brevibacillus laterosporus]|uniref:hypothetical protein n=1 Tax=Brevibacillus laterosporus TaxID=1465 RepID=UPI0015E2210B|nr:hypothetical protein [Brevibacillus laterosporus]
MNISEFDQLAATFTDHAKVLFEYMKKLQDVGFSREEALQLTINFQTNLAMLSQK